MPYVYAKYRTPRRIQGRAAKQRGKKMLTDLMKIVRNPFNVVTDARIPDGKCNMSLPVKVQAVQQIDFGGSETEHDFFFFPGLNAGLEHWDVSDFAGSHVVTPIDSHARASSTGAQSNAVGQIIQWRTVSAGLRLSLVNNAITNEGWFECARISLPKESDSWSFTQRIDGNFSSGNYYPGIDNADTFIPATRGSLRNHPTYATGKLRDIDQVMFNLKANADVHELNTLKDGSSNNEAYRFVDEGFDAIWIRVHGVGGQTKLLANYVLNQEIVYDEAAELARAMTGVSSLPYVASALRSYRNRRPGSALHVPSDVMIISPPRRGVRRMGPPLATPSRYRTGMA